MQKLNLLLANCSVEFVSQVRSHTTTDKNFSEVKVIRDFGRIQELLDNSLINSIYEYVVVTINTMSDESLAVFLRIATLLHGSKTNLICICDTSDEKLLKNFCAIGADECIVGPITGKRLCEIITQMAAKNIEQRANNLEKEIVSSLLSIGILPNIEGFRYLNHAMRMVYEDSGTLRAITTQIYPEIADIFGSTPSRVERSIRHAIESAWQSGRLERINYVLGCDVYQSSKKPTNSQIIALLAENLIQKFGAVN